MLNAIVFMSPGSFSVKSVGMSRRRVPGGFQRHSQQCQTQDLCRRDEMPRRVRTDEQCRDQQGVLALALSREGNEIGKAGLFGTTALAGWVVSCEGKSAMPGAQAAKFLDGVQNSVAGHRPRDLG
jgi:hypothetical protein